MRNRTTIALVGAAALTGGFFVATGGSAVAGHTVEILDAELRGRSEVPDRGDVRGRGSATVFGVDGNANLLCYVIRVERIDPATAAHIHEAPEGVAGPVVVSLAPPSDGDSAGCVETDLAQEILADPQEYYVNVHNAPFPAGAVRGQLES